MPPDLQNATVVLSNCFAEGSGLPCVVPDEVQGGRTATEVLLAAGHTRIAFMNSVEDAPATRGRLEGYRSALEAHGVAFDEDLVFDPAAPSRRAARPPARADSSDPPPTAVFCYNDRVAMGLYDALRRARACRCRATWPWWGSTTRRSSPPTSAPAADDGGAAPLRDRRRAACRCCSASSPAPECRPQLEVACPPIDGTRSRSDAQDARHEPHEPCPAAHSISRRSATG